MTEADFYEKWGARLVVLGLRGLAHELDERVKGPLQAGRYALQMTDKVQLFLRDLMMDAGSVHAAKALKLPAKPKETK